MARSHCTLIHFTLTVASIALVLSCLPFAHAHSKRARSCKARTSTTVPPHRSATPTSTISAVPTASSTPTSHIATPTSSSSSPSATNCFPALGFQMPDDLPQDTTNWWCDASTEYAFLGFSYEVSACQSTKQLQKEFADIRNTFNSRYVRLYGACDKKGFYDDVVEAAWENGLGVHALIWFGFDGSEKWKSWRDSLFKTLLSNPKAKFVTRVVQFGSEPLFDGAIDPGELAKQVLSAKKQLADVGIPVTVSDMAYGYQKQGDQKQAQAVLDAIDSINVHMLPFFSPTASTADKCWPTVQNDLKWFTEHGKGKKMYFSENGWPSVTGGSTEPTSPDAVANVENERVYFQLLDDHCEELKAQPGGGVGWIAHIYSEDQEPGYGIYGSNGKTKFKFAPKTHC